MCQKHLFIIPADKTQLAHKPHTHKIHPSLFCPLYSYIDVIIVFYFLQLAISVWQEYLYYSMRAMGEPGGVEAVRNNAERAISSIGLHVVKGFSTWEAYREFECAILSMLQPAPGAIASAESRKQSEQQTARIITLFKRQLSIPLLGRFCVSNFYY